MMNDNDRMNGRPGRGPQLALDDERALLALYDFAVACRALDFENSDFEDYDVAELLRDAAAVLERLGIAAGAPEM